MLPRVEPALDETHTPAPWFALAPNAAEAFSAPSGLLLLSSAVAATVVASPSGLDHEIRAGIRGSAIGSDAFGDVALVTGYVAPVLVPVALLGAGAARRSSQEGASKDALLVHGSAAAQAVVVTFGATLLLKAATGRPFPLHGADPNAPDRLEHPEYAREWRPFSLRGNLAWPSGHTSAMFALASSLSASTGSVWVTVAGYGAASAVGLGMMAGDRHWASDVLAGALLGQAVGDAVGRSFRRRFLGPSSEVTWTPSVTTSGLGISVAGTWR